MLNPAPTKTIEVVFIDLGNTLRVLIKDPAHIAAAQRRLAELVGTEEDPAAFCARLDERYKGYRKWAFEHLKEAPESELWTRWMTPDFPPEKVGPLGAELTYLYRQSLGRRVVVDGGRAVVAELQRRGYTLGIISNLIGTREIPEWLENEDFAQYFKAVALSSTMGIRKPAPEIYLQAARQAGARPENCAYVGDNLKRDVTGARRAGFGLVVILVAPEEWAQATVTVENRPDVVIHDFRELLNVFPGRKD